MTLDPRLRRVLAYVDAHLDEPLDLDQLASIASLSKFHFRRTFEATFGMSPSRWVQLVRLRRSASRVRVEDVPDVEVAVLEHRAGPIGASLRRFIEWRRAAGLGPDRSDTFNVFFDDPRTTPPDRLRLDLCAAISGDVAPNDVGIVRRTLVRGRCAVFRHTGRDEELGDVSDRVVAEELPRLGETVAARPVVLHRLTFFPEVPEHEVTCDVYLPLEPRATAT